MIFLMVDNHLWGKVRWPPKATFAIHPSPQGERAQMKPLHFRDQEKAGERQGCSVHPTAGNEQRNWREGLGVGWTGLAQIASSLRALQAWPQCCSVICKRDWSCLPRRLC